MIIADTSGLLALFNRREPAHAEAVEWLERGESIVVSPFVTAELDYLVATRLGIAAELAMVRELASGAYDHPALNAADLLECAGLMERYRDLQIGITDASLVVLADRYRTRSILTLDHRHFTTIRPMSGGHFDLLPAAS